MEDTIIGGKKEESATQEIFKAVYDKGKIQIQLNTNHLPMLSYCLKLLELEITNRILELNTKPAEEKKIITPVLTPIINIDEIKRTSH